MLHMKISIFIFLSKIWQKNNKMQKMNLYANERLLLVLAIKQKRFLKNIWPHWFFGLGAKISILALNFVILIFGLSNHYFCIPCPKIHIGMYFHNSNIIRTIVIKEKWLMLECQIKNLRALKNGFLRNCLEFRQNI